MEKNNNRKIMLFGILGLLIVLCILGFWFVFDKKEEVKEEPEINNIEKTALEIFDKDKIEIE